MLSGKYFDEPIDITGWIFSKVEREGDEALLFTRSDGKKFRMDHSQNCCEQVEIESITDDLSDLVGTPILLAEERVSEETPGDYTHEYEPESQTWTFYTFRTIKGTVDIRWFGRSNGCYSESVEFYELRGDI
jgi:hypothetical protein